MNLTVHGMTIVHPLALSITICMCLLVLFVPRKCAVFPLLILAFLITAQQRIVISGLDFTMMRLLLLFGFVRIVLRNEAHCISLNRIDTSFMFLIFLMMVIPILRERTSEAFVRQAGRSIDGFGLYFFYRVLIRDDDDVRNSLRFLMSFAFLISIFALFEYSTGRNVFSIFGGVPEITTIRDGEMRVQGAFPHPLMLGVFGATLVPLSFGLLFECRKNAIFSIAGIIAGTILTFVSSSSGPIAAFMAGIIGLVMWPFRRKMYVVRRGIIVTLFVLHFFVMKAPVWALVNRIPFVSGHGFHRFNLIDAAIRRFSEWWLLGLTSTNHWGYGLWDITNHYIAVGINGGFISLAVFLYVLVLCFRNIGILVSDIEKKKTMKAFAWSLGAAAFSHSIAFIGMAYFGPQIFASWYLLISIIARKYVIE